MTSSHSNRQVNAALLTVQVIFGVHYLVARGIVTEISPAAWAATRVAAATVILAGLTLATRRRWPHPRHWGWLAVCAVFGVAANQILFLEGLARTTASRAALINSQIPTFALLAAIVMKQESLSRRKVGSFVLAIGGVVVLLEADKLQVSNQYLTGDLLNLANALSYGLFIAISRRVMPRHDTMSATTMVFVFGLVLVAAYGGNQAIHLEWASISSRTIGGMIFAVLGATVLTYGLNVWALQRVRTSRVALWIFLQPVVAASLDLALGSTLTPRFLVATVLVFLALLIRDDS
jgi:drug/metabolite transporter (DMT)-like permease